MNTNLRLATLVISFLLAVAVNSPAQKPGLSADEVMRKTSDKLASLKSVGYTAKLEYNYASESYLAEIAVDGFIDFTPVGSALGVRFQFSHGDTFDVYNGSERFFLKKKARSITVEPKINAERLATVTPLRFSPMMLRNALPKVINDRSILRSVSESTVNGRRLYIVELTLDRSAIEPSTGEIEPLTNNLRSIYRISIDRETYLPTGIYRGNDQNKDFNRATYTTFTQKPTAPTERSWYFSSYLDEYKYAEPAKDTLIKIGEAAFDFSLPLFSGKGSGNFAASEGKVTLLNFWIVHCGFCQDSVPKINALHEKYKDKNVNIVSVNISDSLKLIQTFIDQRKVRYPIAVNGEEIAKKYGVPGYPMMILIGKDGKAVYVGRVDQPKLESLIDDSLAK
jgi:thiol-disulfide isomerase/thioredoxin